MEFGFTDEQEVLRGSAREVLAAKAGPAVYRKALEKSKDGTDAPLWKTVSELGWTGVAIDEGLGGLGLGLIELAILQEELGRAVAPVPFFSTVAFAGQIVEQFDASPARDAFLGRVAAGESRATVALGEKDGRFDAAGVGVKAVRTESGGWKFSGTALLAPEAHLADEIVVLARTTRAKDPAEGISAFIVPSSALRSKPKPQPSLDGGRRLADVKLGGVEVPAEALLGTADHAWPAVARGLDRAAVLLAAEAVGAASRALEIAVEYAKERKQFDRPIGSFQAISHKCADMLLWVESARSHVYYAAWALDEGTPDAHLAAASAKAAASDAARIAANDSIQVHGGIGFTWESEMHLYYRRAKFCELFLGDASQWRERIAQALVSA
ncbi:MAG TPA: acyl-CoA dehydrogenase family protein [Actinomycetota bacterium]|nr:acyl-CoA dehydrogenase family protein [Actinomycetota bacterium]